MWEFDRSDYDTIAMAYSTSTSQVLIAKTDSSGTESHELYAYHIPTKRWDFYDIDSAIGTYIAGMFTSPKTGTTYLTDNTKYRSLWTNSTRLTWVWRSKEIDFNDPSQLKRFYEIETLSTGGTPTVKRSMDSGTIYTAIGSVSFPETKKTYMLEVTSAVTTVLDSISIIFRRFWGEKMISRLRALDKSPERAIRELYDKVNELIEAVNAESFREGDEAKNRSPVKQRHMRDNTANEKIKLVKTTSGKYKVMFKFKDGWVESDTTESTGFKFKEE